MSYKQILVHVDDSDGSKARVELASQLAGEHGAQLTGLYRVPEIDLRIYTDATWGVEKLDETTQAIENAAVSAQTLFEAVTAASGVEAQWRRTEAHFASALSVDAHYTDLIITGQTMPGSVDAVAETFVLESGRPAMVVPQVAIRSKNLKRILIAWTERREACRAVHDALPILQKAEHVDVLAIAPKEADMDDARIAAERLGRYLASHGVPAEPRHDVAQDMNVQDIILSRAADLQSDMLVMGAYGHSKLREMVLGGATRGLLEHMTVPVLMSH